ncbi:MAG: o-succinylbenzoate synthase [Candidatus Marinimicrobia bacterium]|nr:o-succinylbenzoate synthase [Candidatus Neomarinimicrobiota bacterium]MCF7828225.1 o-succinylbenzoate synthase [Candidatus Neomarinimicrobiota bacterium]MCF7879600.1 o-succinylbenzoate synthase [Candidatus Neomarinimicrobiota bacterium]
MNITGIRYKPYRIPFVKPLRTASGVIYFRKGVLIWLDTESEVSGVGEAAPLSGFSTEFSEDVIHEIHRLQDQIKQTPVTIPVEFEHMQIPELLTSELPTLQYALDTALWDLAGQFTKKPVAALLSTNPARSIDVNGTIGQHSQKKTLTAARELVEAGFRVLKIKIGRAHFQEDLACIRVLRESVPESIQLRLDANQAWAPEAAFDNLTQLAEYDIEYCEQPIPAGDLTALAKLKKNSPIPIAADEDARTLESVKKITDRRAADVIILKPGFLGVRTTIEAIKFAESHNMRVVLTSVFDTTVGRAMACQLAAAFLPGETHGLADGYLQADFAEMSYTTQDGKVIIPDSPGLGVEVDSDLGELFVK